MDTHVTGDLLHGGALAAMQAAFPTAPQPWVDLSTGINPWSYPIAPRDTLPFAHLPDRDAFDACRTAMAVHFGAPAACVLPTPGTEIVIRLLPQILKARRVVVAEPTYGDHLASWRQAGVRLEAMSDPLLSVAQPDVDVIVLCNPNNPDGRRWACAELQAARETLASRGGMLIVDEAYVDLDPTLSLAELGGEAGLIILRSFGKFFGLAGLRLGAVLAPDEVLDALRNILGVWSVSGPALHIGSAAYADASWHEQTRKRLRDGARELDGGLRAAELFVSGGTDLFRYVESDDAIALWRHLAGYGIYVRRFAWSTRHLRVGLPQSADEMNRLSTALKCFSP